MSVDRRTFLAGALAGGATLGVGACRSGDDASPPTSAPAERTDPDAATGAENLGGGEYLEFEGAPSDRHRRADDGGRAARRVPLHRLGPRRAGCDVPGADRRVAPADDR
ncbi:MAG: twin-arginine translocation signal domain-containing protein [Actinomycetota bacterium]|nr:twin-arginine translocation signal domain-containing protein [Actinomycetota bacterium]